MAHPLLRGADVDAVLQVARGVVDGVDIGSE